MFSGSPTKSSCLLRKWLSWCFEFSFWGRCSYYWSYSFAVFISVSFFIHSSNWSITLLYSFLYVFHIYLMQFISTANIIVQVIIVLFFLCCEFLYCNNILMKKFLLFHVSKWPDIQDSAQVVILSSLLPATVMTNLLLLIQSFPFSSSFLLCHVLCLEFCPLLLLLIGLSLFDSVLIFPWKLHWALWLW